MNWLLKLWDRFTGIEPSYSERTPRELAQKFRGDIIGLGLWLEAKIWYKKDETPEDEYRPATETLRLAYGDCEDFAILAYEVLKEMGVTDVHILTLYPAKGRGHAICVFKSPQSGKTCWMDNGVLNVLNSPLNYRGICEQAAKVQKWKLHHWHEVNTKGHLI